VIRIRLTRKLAAVLNGIDVSSLQVGDTLELPDSAAERMIAERWAERIVDPMVVNPPLQQPTGPNCVP
jgi:hypothetical protein